MPGGHALYDRIPIVLLAVPQAQDEHQPQGDDQLQVVSLPQQEQDDEQEQQVPAVQILQLQGLQQAAQSPPERPVRCCPFGWDVPVPGPSGPSTVTRV